MTAEEAMEIWRQVAEFEFMDMKPIDGAFKFFGTAQDGSTKIEIIHTDTLKIIARDLIPFIEQ